MSPREASLPHPLPRAFAKFAKILGGPSLAALAGMASHRFLTFFLASSFFLGCTARDDGEDATTTAGEGQGSTTGDGTDDSGEDPTDTDGEDPTDTDGGESSSGGGSSTGDTDGETCDGPGCFIPCQELDAPPPGLGDCYDQGPGECADAAIPSSCANDGHWVCPDGWDFYDYGEDCTFPGE